MDDITFIKIVSESKLSERKLAESLGMTRTALAHKYKTLTFKPYDESRICELCNSTFMHKVESYRDITKYCPPCKKGIQSDACHSRFSGVASKKRIPPTQAEIDTIKAFILENTHFTSISRNANRNIALDLLCKCGNIVTLDFKVFKHLNRFDRKSCGCSSPRNTMPIIKLKEFLESLGETGILDNKRPKFMNGLELDLWVPSKNFAIEYHGLAYHSERSIYGDRSVDDIRKNHEKKYLFTKAAGISLFQIFEDEWLSKSDIIKSMIESRLGIFKAKVGARKCILKEVPPEEASNFFNENHISGSTANMKTFGLYLEDVLVSALSLRNCWQKNYGNAIEIARFASLQGFQVVGGFSKLLKAVTAFSKAAGYEAILTYADCRFGSGNVYSKAGFEHLGKTGPNYFYEKSGVRESRFKHRKQETLEGDTEREQQNALGWYAIYDAGSEIYRLDLTNQPLKNSP